MINQFKNIPIGIFTLLLLFFSGCHSEYGDSNYAAMPMPDYAEVSLAEITSSQSLETVERGSKLIKEGRVSFQTDNIGQARELIFRAVEEYQAYVSSDREQQGSNRVTATMVIRMLAENFDEFLAAATHGVGQFENKVIEVIDVTEEFVDVEARLKTINNH